MSTKENAAVSQLLALLEARYALRVLWALRDGHAQTFRLLQDSVGGITPNTLNTRIKELREAGLVGHGSEGYSLTLSGQDLLKRLSDLQAFAGKWQLGQLKKAAVAVPAPSAAAPAAAAVQAASDASGAPAVAASPAPVAAPASAPVPPAPSTDDSSKG
ncbi:MULTISPECIES: helix-turn-helix domain-containing protein [unclassified Variovorax]|uniref:winged helix-turn-helix transcriptional regulator n=1 Tax=unclassified Variovorax TaxID=663243 RepID=UPI0008C42285|nr:MULTISPECIES: winged helix-turn-helix transcriptional regulator [unclassified Variovorax]SEJ27573.1 transcriptional regulator, HxlR family [Variovorax sp. OK202]SFC20755.1 transcriptional regulator, HxlR family [Variovorax sp. OK212]